MKDTTYVFITCHGKINYTKKNGVSRIDPNILENVNIRKINAVRPGILNYTFSNNIHYMINLILYFITYNIIINMDMIANCIITILKDNDSSLYLYQSKSIKQIEEYFKYNDDFSIDKYFLNYFHDLSHMYYFTSTLIYDKIYEIYKNENDNQNRYNNQILFINKQGKLQSIFKRSEFANIHNKILISSTSDIIKKLKKDFNNIFIIDLSCMELEEETNRYIRNIKNNFNQL